MPGVGANITVGPHYAGFWLRAAALLIDVFLVYFVLFALIGIFLGGAHLTGADLTGTAINLGFNATLALSIVLYFALFESSRLQATPGKLAVGVHVTDTDGYRIGFFRAGGRYFGKMLSALPLFAGFIMAAFTKRSQALHDRMARCVVVCHRVRMAVVANDQMVA